ncbi:hypothetical protein scyTo_0020673, partial [Scyliorhinus torazame]|nr:hypothetical protein [Scyliorhinus torazame]
ESFCDYLHFGPGARSHCHHSGCRNDLLTEAFDYCPQPTHWCPRLWKKLPLDTLRLNLHRSCHLIPCYRT